MYNRLTTLTTTAARGLAVIAAILLFPIELGFQQTGITPPLHRALTPLLST